MPTTRVDGGADAEPRTSLARVNSMRIRTAIFGNSVPSARAPTGAFRLDIGERPPPGDRD